MSDDNQTRYSTLYGITRDGHLAALVGNDAFAMLPANDGTNYLARAWRLGRPIGDWTQADFPRHHTQLVTEADFRRHVDDAVQHRHQLAELNRRSVSALRSTPWGLSQHAVVYGDGIIAHITPGHGGFSLTPERNNRIHILLRSDDGFYEEDCAWVAVAQAFPELFTDFEKGLGDNILRDAYPDAWEAIHNQTIPPGQSRVKDRRDFDKANADRWVVISAILSSHRPNSVECIATLGGRRHGDAIERRYLVPEDEYDIGAFGFVIDECRHQEYRGPSDFRGWIEAVQRRQPRADCE